MHSHGRRRNITHHAGANEEPMTSMAVDRTRASLRACSAPNRDSLSSYQNLNLEREKNAWSEISIEEPPRPVCGTINQCRLEYAGKSLPRWDIGHGVMAGGVRW